MKTTTIGRQAEIAVARQLSKQGFKILAQNWRTRRCEIDLVAQKDKIIYFIEVKYRSGLTQGDGLAYITNRKLDQLNFAARMWLAVNDWEGDWRLLAASVGPKNEVEQVVEL